MSPPPRVRTARLCSGAAAFFFSSRAQMPLLCASRGALHRLRPPRSSVLSMSSPLIYSCLQEKWRGRISSQGGPREGGPAGWKNSVSDSEALRLSGQRCTLGDCSKRHSREQASAKTEIALLKGKRTTGSFSASLSTSRARGLKAVQSTVAAPGRSEDRAGPPSLFEFVSCWLSACLAGRSLFLLVCPGWRYIEWQRAASEARGSKGRALAPPPTFSSAKRGSLKAMRQQVLASSLVTQIDQPSSILVVCSDFEADSCVKPRRCCHFLRAARAARGFGEADDGPWPCTKGGAIHRDGPGPFRALAPPL